MASRPGSAREMPALTAARHPLLGLVVLLVEDSRYCSESIRLMCLRSGARLRRADSLRSARRHLANYRPSVVIVDLGLPDGNGLDLVRSLAAMGEGAPALIAISGDDTPGSANAARMAGARTFMAKPIRGLAEFQSAILDCFPERTSVANSNLLVFQRPVEPDLFAVREDLLHILAILEQPLAEEDGEKLGYCCQFLSSLAGVCESVDLARPCTLLRQMLARADTQKRVEVVAMLQAELAKLPSV